MARMRRWNLESTVNDGKIGLFTILAPDERAAALRDQSRDRHEARIYLKTGNEDAVVNKQAP